MSQTDLYFFLNIPSNVNIEFKKSEYGFWYELGNVTYLYIVTLHYHTGSNRLIELRMFGTKGQTHWVPLDEERNDFERGQTDVFKVTSDNIGRIFRIELRIKGSRDAWFGSKVSGRVYTDPITVYNVLVYYWISICLKISVLYLYLRIYHIRHI